MEIPRNDILHREQSRHLNHQLNISYEVTKWTYSVMLHIKLEQIHLTNCDFHTVGFEI